MPRFIRDACLVIAAAAGIAIAYRLWVLNEPAVLTAPPPPVPQIEHASAPPQAIAPPPSPASADPAALDLAFWNSIKDDKTPDAYQEYLRAFPDGVFAGLARLRIQQLAEPRVLPQRQGAITRPPEQARRQLRPI
jgi:hypothetical protein